MKTSEWLLLIMVILAFAVGAWAYPQLPAIVPSHWDANGIPNGSMSSFWAVFILPIVMACIALMLFLVPRMDPKRENIAKFRKFYNYFTVTLLILFFWIFGLMLLYYFGYRFNFILALIPILAGLFWIIGMLLPHTLPNWTIGIRTPWTISSDHVWKKTHQLGEPLFKFSALIALFGILFPQCALWFLVVPVVASAITLIVYSYVIYEKGRR